MSVRRIASFNPDSFIARKATASPFRHSHQNNISRRSFLRVAAGAAAAGAFSGALGLRPWESSPALASKGSGEPTPIPYGIDLGGGLLIHVRLPGLVHPENDDPSTIYDFNGAVAFTVIDGMGTRTNLVTGETAHLPFEVDMRSMDGVFVDTTSRVHRGTFVLV
ncbi:MAG TPA: twin-arginine translocation signal domain-containing protein [Dehalococcoidia bacterium]|jgi:hypothetical protein|nr:twin-arginine translocation signal domain-containing protein [Dehalococcoidia bacterium]